VCRRKAPLMIACAAPGYGADGPRHGSFPHRSCRYSLSQRLRFLTRRVLFHRILVSPALLGCSLDERLILLVLLVPNLLAWPCGQSVAFDHIPAALLRGASRVPF